MVTGIFLQIKPYYLTQVKDFIISSSLARLYVEKFRDGELIDDDHLITHLENNMPIIVNRHDNCVCWFIRLLGRWDSNEKAAIQQLLKPGFIVIEVGANFGVNTLEMASIVGREGHVYSFEANPLVSKYLKKSISMNNLDSHVTIFEKAAGNITKDTFLTFGLQNIGGGHLVNTSHGHAIKTKMVRLDDIFGSQTNINLLKIDAEGSEQMIIEGAQNIISSNPQLIIMMEWSKEGLIRQGSNPRDLIKTLQSNHFKAWKISKRVGSKPTFISTTYEELNQIEYGDFVFVKNESQLNG